MPGKGKPHHPSKYMQESWCGLSVMQNRSQASELRVIGENFFSLKCEPNGSSNRELVPYH